MRIKEIGVKGTTLDCVDINLILGANNTGKSTFIRELEGATKNCEIMNSPNKWITGVVIESSGGKSKIDTLLPSLLKNANYDSSEKEFGRLGTQIFGTGNWSPSIFQKIIDKADTPVTYTVKPTTSGNHRDDEWTYFGFMASLATSIENCDTRLSGPFTTQISRLEEPYKDIVHYFYTQPILFKKISDHIKQVFSIEIIFDSLAQGTKDIRLKPNITIPASFPDLRTEARFWEEHSPLLQSQGDGLKAYLKIIFALFNPSKEIVIIDEPEAFLHSPQRRSLGKFIADNASSGKQLFISTHDSEFLRGVLTNTTSNTQVIHLKDKLGNREYTINKMTNTAQTRTYNELILNSYFNKLTVLCEAEDDRMAYQHASRIFFPTETVDVHFIGLNGKTDLLKSFQELQKLKIDVSAIADIDILYSGECLLLSIEASDKALLQEVQKDLKALLVSGVEKAAFKQGGISYVTDAGLKKKVEQAIEAAKKYKIYIVTEGELESWLDSPIDRKKLVQTIKNEVETNPSTSKKLALKELIKQIIV